VRPSSYDPPAPRPLSPPSNAPSASYSTGSAAHDPSARPAVKPQSPTYPSREESHSSGFAPSYPNRPYSNNSKPTATASRPDPPTRPASSNYEPAAQPPTNSGSAYPPSSPGSSYPPTSSGSSYPSTSGAPAPSSSTYEYQCEAPTIPQPSASLLSKPHALLARIHSSGFHGYALFAADSASASELQVHVHVTHSRSASGQAPREAFSWRVYDTHSASTDKGCVAFIGQQALLHDLTLALGPVVSGRAGQLRWQLNEDSASSSSSYSTWYRSLLGKTILLIGAESGVRICASLLPAGPKHVFDIYMHTPIAGRLQLIQPIGYTETALLSDYIMYSNGERKETRHRWQVVEATLPAAKDSSIESIERFRHESNACSDLHGKYMLSAQQTVRSRFITIVIV
jgi:hypothetical protein